MLRMHSAICALVAMAAVTAEAQRGGATSSSSRPVSASTMAVYAAHETEDGPMLDVLVLWRGSPGWFAREGKRMSSGGGSEHAITVSSTWAGRTLTVQFDRTTKMAKINDKEISLATANVLLLDEADADGGPAVMGLKWIEPRVDDLRDPIPAVIKRSPELFEYVQCDLPEAQHGVYAALCSQVRPQ